MIKVYVPNVSNTPIGGGFTFLRNFKKALDDKVQFVNTWQESDIVFVFGITTMDKTEIHEAVKAGKKFVLRVDNIPRKSRNRRQSPAERLKEFGKLADKVVYQSEWCKEFAGYFAGEGVIINNGVDTEIFNLEDRESDGNTCLYIDYNPNPNKRFDEAIYRFEMMWRENNKLKLVIAGNAPKEYLENPDYNWDLNVPAEVEYYGLSNTPQEVADVMKHSDILIYPSICEAYPNTVLEAMACGMSPKYLNEEGGSVEAFWNSVKDMKMDIESVHFLMEEVPIKGVKVKTIQEMGDEYLKLFEELIN